MGCLVTGTMELPWPKKLPIFYYSYLTVLTHLGLFIAKFSRLVGLCFFSQTLYYCQTQNGQVTRRAVQRKYSANSSTNYKKAIMKT